MMENFKQECKLCNNPISGENFKVIEGVAKNIFEVLLLKLTLNETQNVICTMCSSKLLAALNFKKTCLYTDNTIRPYVDFNNPKPVDLKEIYAKEKGSKQVDDREVCRLCLLPFNGDHKSIQEVPVGSIEIYIPEINFEAPTSPAICIKCHDALHVHSTFVKKCLDVNKKRNGDAVNGQEMFLNNQSIKTEDIEIKSEETNEEMLFDPFCDIKKEEHKKGDTSVHSQTDSTHTEESKSMYERDHQKQTSAQSWFANNQSEECRFKTTSADHKWQHKRAPEAQVNKSDCTNRNSKRHCSRRGLKVQEYQCDKCTYNTKRKDYFMKHQLKHKDPSEVQMYECDECPYRSIRKQTLKLHQVRHKNSAEVRVFKCDECDYKGIQKAHLRQHQLTHIDPSEVRMFKCDKCTYETKQKNNLVKHCLTHKDLSEVEMYKCEKCKFMTKHKWSLTQHCLSHKDPSEVQMFMCDECDYKSIHKGNLKQHQLIHKDPSEVKMFKCDKCTFETKHKNNLIKHCLTHKDPIEVRVFQCDECDYKSIKKGNFERHRLRHKDRSEVQMYMCDKCKFQTKEKWYLVRHCLNHK